MSSPTYYIPSPSNKEIGKIKIYLNNEFISCYDKDKGTLRYLHLIGDNTYKFVKENEELGTIDINLDDLINKMIDDRLSRRVKKKQDK